MIDHISIGVRDLAASACFYEASLTPLEYRRRVDTPARTAFGTRYPEIWLNSRPAMSAVDTNTGSHICLRARSIAAVDSFYVIAIAHGGYDDGPPGLRQATMVEYYAAFVRDPDGHRIEVMTVPQTR